MGSRCLQTDYCNKQNDFNISEETSIPKNKIGADGKIEIVTANMKFDTLSNGRIVEKIQTKLLRFLLMKRDVFKTEF
jgi:hypothetical protein